LNKVGTVIQYVLAAILVIYAADWYLLHYRIGKGTAFQTIPVEQYLQTPLKGNKAEYDYMGTQPETCSRSLFPQSGDPPCWWLSKHRQHWQ
jgi:uncharacterized membrane protein